MKKIFAVFLLFVYTSLMIQAQTTYYIDPAGSDATGNGTSGNPWKSLYKACVTVKSPGDVIHVNAGTYTETTQSVLAIGVSIEGTGATSIIISNITTAHAGTLYLASGKEGTNGNQHISGIYFDGNNRTTYCAIWVLARSNVEISNCTFINYDKYGIRFHGEVAGNSPSTNLTYATGNSVHDCVITNCAYYQHNVGGGADLLMSCQTGFDCYNNIITQSRTAYTNGCGIKTGGWTRGLQIHGNTLTGQILSDKEVPDSWDFAIEMWGDHGSVTEGTHIYDNKIYNWEIDIAGRITKKGDYDYGCSIHDNFIGCLSLPPVNKIGIWLEANTSLSDIYIYNNHIKNVNKGIGLYCTDQGWDQTPSTASVSFTNIFIFYNILENIGYDVNGFDNGRGIIWTEARHSTNTVENLKIYNNIITASTKAGSTQWGGIVLVSKAGVEAKSFEIKNNIIVGFENSCISNNSSWQTGTGSIDYLNIQNNVFYGNGRNNVPYISIVPTHSTNSGNLVSNPLFVSSTDFHLQGISPAINNGVSINLPVSYTDYAGNKVGNPPSIGAYEYLCTNTLPSIKDQGFQLDQNSPDDTSVGTVVASDPDPGQTLTYSIVAGNTSDAFAINATTGELSVANSKSVNADFSLVVRVRDNGTDHLYSQASIAINVITAGIESTENNQTIKVYPNPVSDELNIELKGNNERLSFNILNSQGQIVFEGNLTEKAVVLMTSFSPGVYLMKIEDGRNFEFKKIVKV